MTIYFPARGEPFAAISDSISLIINTSYGLAIIGEYVYIDNTSVAQEEDDC